MNYLLDTCTFLWLALEPKKLSPDCVAVINNPANDLYLSDVTLWEVISKHNAGKLPLPLAPRSWLLSRRAYFHLHPLRLKESAICLSGELATIHTDPFDRLLAAQAMDAVLTILSPDTSFSTLGAVRIW